MDSLLYSHEIAKEMIYNIDESNTLLLPVLTKYETNSLMCCLEIMFKFYVDGGSSKMDLETKLINVLNETFTYYLSLASKLQQDDWNGLLIMIYGQILAIDDGDEKFVKLAPTLYYHSCDILSAVQISKELKSVICQMLKRIGSLYGIKKSK